MENPSKWDEIFVYYRVPVFIILLGLIACALGVLFYKKDVFVPQTKVEVLNATTESHEEGGIIAEISGSVVKSGVYKMPSESRIDDLLISAGGFSGDADRDWADKYLNRAGVLTDGQKIYIPHSGETSAKSSGGDQTLSVSLSSDSNGLININNSTLKELDTLPGIGQTYGQNIIDHRPYSKPEELVSKGAIKQNVFDKIKNRVTIY